MVEFVETEQYKVTLKYQINCAILYSNTPQKTLLKKKYVFSEIYLIQYDSSCLQQGWT